MTNNKPLLPAQRKTLLAMVNAGRLSDRDMHWATRMALVSLGYIRMVERFASGHAVYSITRAGRIALATAVAA